MGFIRNMALLAGGAALGYFASRTRTTNQHSTDLTPRQGSVVKPFTEEGGPLAQFFDSPVGAPFKGAAVKVLTFAAQVKAGMDSKEAELKERFDRQTHDVRPGSLNTWDDPTPSEKLGVDHQTHQLNASRTENQLAGTHQRLARDADLGQDFFASAKQS